LLGENPEANMEEAGLFVKTISRWWNDVERLRPAPQGRAQNKKTF
jgi:hypothetical protein